MALVFKKGLFGSPARRHSRLWAATTAPESTCVAERDEDSYEFFVFFSRMLKIVERKGELYVLVREMFEANEV